MTEEVHTKLDNSLLQLELSTIKTDMAYAELQIELLKAQVKMLKQSSDFYRQLWLDSQKIKVEQADN